MLCVLYFGCEVFFFVDGFSAAKPMRFCPSSATVLKATLEKNKEYLMTNFPRKYSPRAPTHLCVGCRHSNHQDNRSKYSPFVESLACHSAWVECGSGATLNGTIRKELFFLVVPVIGKKYPNMRHSKSHTKSCQSPVPG